MLLYLSYIKLILKVPIKLGQCRNSDFYRTSFQVKKKKNCVKHYAHTYHVNTWLVIKWQLWKYDWRLKKLLFRWYYQSKSGQWQSVRLPIVSQGLTLDSYFNQIHFFVWPPVYNTVCGKDTKLPKQSVDEHPRVFASMIVWRIKYNFGLQLNVNGLLNYSSSVEHYLDQTIFLQAEFYFQ